MHGVESGPVVVAVIYPCPRPTKVLVVDAHTSYCFSTRHTLDVASPLVQNRSIDLGPDGGSLELIKSETYTVALVSSSIVLSLSLC
jgi:hypothetical protein